MKKQVKITNPDELNKNLTYNSPVTWIVLGSVIALLLGFFAWSLLFQIPIRLSGKASIHSGEVSLKVEATKANELKAGQKVYIAGKEGNISSFDDKQDPILSGFALPDGEYDCYVVLKEIKPIEFWFNKN